MIEAKFTFTVLNKSSLGQDELVDVSFSILRKPDAGPSRVAVFAVVRNEMYFLPHFLRHYRDLGVREFWFLDDGSTDGTRDFLLAQPDCGTIEANLAFADRVGHLRFGVATKTLVPRALLQGRWVLTVDADEFLLLPRAFATIDVLVPALERAGLKVARAPMVDFFPETLRALSNGSPDGNPFALCPNFDAWETLDWPDGEREPRDMSLYDGVRARMFVRLFETTTALRTFFRSYKLPSMFKVPLLYWEAGTEMYSPHHSTASPSDRIQLALAHFKFYPGYTTRIADALRTRAYWQESIEYRFLDVAARELLDWPLAGPRSRRFNSPNDAEEAGLLFSHITPHADS